MSSTRAATAASPLETILRRDRAVVLAALGAIAVLCWAYIIWLATGRPDMGKDHGAMMMGAEIAPWTSADFLLMFLMWAAMMIGMMTPSVAPMILIYARVAREAGNRGKLFAPVSWFASGYFLAWIVFSMLATLLQWGLEQSLLISPMAANATPKLAGGLLIVAGLYQWTPLKNACLSNCQSPLLFIQRHGGFSGEPWAALTLGLRHGAYCIGCCWALMLLLFVGGVMSLLLIGAIAALALAEKLIRGRLLQHVTGIAFVISGVAFLS